MEWLTESKLRRIFHLLLPAWALMLAGPIAGGLELSVLGVVGLVILAVVVGLGAGRGVWSLVSAASGRRVRRLAEELADEGGGHPGTGPKGVHGAVSRVVPVRKVASDRGS